MANEAICIEKPTIIKRYSVVDGNAIAKGTILALSGAEFYALPSTVICDKFAGIAIEEKTASDGILEIGAAIDGVWDIVCQADTTVTLGNLVCLSGANLIRDSAEADFPLGKPFGKAQETGSTSERIRVRLGLN